MRRNDPDGYDGVLPFGEALASFYRGWGWGARVFTWHEAAFFLDAAARCPERSFLLGGNGWQDTAMPGTVRAIGHVGTADRNAFNCLALAMLNVARDSMASVGFARSPAWSKRLARVRSGWRVTGRTWRRICGRLHRRLHRRVHRRSATPHCSVCGRSIRMGNGQKYWTGSSAA